MSGERKYRRAIVYVRRAFRVNDNLALCSAAEGAEEVLPVICLRTGESYARSTPRRRFVNSTISDFDRSLRKIGSRLVVLHGNPEEEIPRAASEFKVDAVFASRIYDPKTLTIDKTISSRLEKQGIKWNTCKDRVLFEGTDILTRSGSPYRVFTPYYRTWLGVSDGITPPLPPPRRLQTPDLGGSLPENILACNGNGGESSARKRLRSFLSGGVQDYLRTRNFPAIDGTSRLSQHLAIGSISARQVYWAALEARRDARPSVRKNIDGFIRELVWREFFYQVLANFPHAATGPFRKQAGAIPWSTRRTMFTRWCEGTTGFPIVDAGMRQLADEGWIHNRVRMIVASFLTKDLHINWQWGERYFMEHLIDADIASNNGGWQWVAGTGTDASPWFRIFNPVTQGKKFDPEGEYVRRYVPELRDIPGSAVHEPWKVKHLKDLTDARTYPSPVINHAEARLQTLELYKDHYSR